VIDGEGTLAGELGAAARAAGYTVRSPHDPLGDELPGLFVDCAVSPAERARASAGEPAHGGARLLLCAGSSLGALDDAGDAVGFHLLPPFAEAQLAELTRGPSSSPVAAQRAERFFESLGKHVAWVGDAPGLILGRIVCQVINESAFALGEGVGDERDIDLGMVLGLSHPRGPFAWADAIGLDHVLAVLDGLWGEYREERYRAAPVLRALARERRASRTSGGGVHAVQA
jgi:3-hydroxybutyryl-CoA dehydrogenase